MTGLELVACGMEYEREKLREDAGCYESKETLVRYMELLEEELKRQLLPWYEWDPESGSLYGFKDTDELLKGKARDMWYYALEKAHEYACAHT